MLIALLSDIHSNLEALQACLKHANEKGAQRFVFLGDLIGYGADPSAVVDVIAGYAAQGWGRSVASAATSKAKCSVYVVRVP